MNLVEKTKRVVDSCKTIEQFDIAERYLRRAQLIERQKYDRAVTDFGSVSALLEVLTDSNTQRLLLLNIQASLNQRRSYLKLASSNWGNP